MPENMKTLKADWRTVKFGDVVKLSKGRNQNPLADGIDRYVGLEHLEPGDLRVRSWGDVADGTTFTNVFKPGQVLFGKRRAYQRKVAVADFTGVCSGDIYVFETKDPSVLLPELLPFICQTDAFFDHAVGTSAGSLSPRTNWTSLADFKFSLPTFEDQLRLTELLSSNESVLKCISETVATLRDLRKSLSATQFPEQNDQSDLLADHYEVVSGQVNPQSDEYRKLPLIAPNHIEQYTGRITALETAEKQAAISGKYLFEKNAVLYSKIRPNLVKAGIAPCKGLCSADMYALIPKESLKGEYLLEILLSDQFTRFAVSGSMRTGIPKLNRDHLAQYKFKVPSLDAQKEYLEKIKDIKTAEENLVNRSEAALHLKKFILAEELKL